MRPLIFTLLADGPSDSALMPILRWVLQKHHSVDQIQSEWADLRRLRPTPTALKDRILAAVDLFPCDVLFVHRDAEREPPDKRYEEIRMAVIAATSEGFSLPLIHVVPVRMQEAWLLFDESAIRKAAGNPNGSVVLKLPSMTSVEDIPDPKRTLYELLQSASEKRGRRLKKFYPAKHAHLIAEHVADFSPLIALNAFRRLESEVKDFAMKGLAHRRALNNAETA